MKKITAYLALTGVALSFSSCSSKPVVDAKSETQGRAISSSASNEPADVIELVRLLESCRDANQLQQLMEEVDAGYDGFTPQAKYFVNQFIWIKPFRGIGWRVKGLFDSRFDRQGVATAADRLTQIFQFLGSVTRIALPYDSSPLLASYLGDRPPGSIGAAQFKSMQDLSDFLRTDVYTQFLKTSRRIASLRGEGSNQFFLPNALLNYAFGLSGGLSIQYSRIHDLRALLLSETAFHFSIYSILSFVAFKEDGIQDLEPKFLASASYSTRDGAAKFRGQKDFLTLKDSKSQALLSSALKHLVFASNLLKAAIDDASQYSEYVTLDWAPVFGLPSDLKAATAELKTRQSLLNSKNPNYDLSKLFKSPPSDLKTLLPTEFETKGQTPTKWDSTAYAPYFIHTPKGGVADAKKALAQHFFGVWVAWPLQLLVY